MRDQAIETLSKRFYVPKKEIQQAINYYLTRELEGIPENILESSPADISDWQNIPEWKGTYQGVTLKIIFEQEGAKQIWLGATHLGYESDSRWEHYLGYTEINQVKADSDIPVDVRIVCGWPPFLPLFQRMADHLRNRLMPVVIRRIEFSCDDVEKFVVWLKQKFETSKECSEPVASETPLENVDGALLQLIITDFSITSPNPSEPARFEVIAKFARVVRPTEEAPSTVVGFENYGPVIRGSIIDRKVIIKWDWRFDGYIRQLLTEFRRLSEIKVLYCNPADLLRPTDNVSTKTAEPDNHHPPASGSLNDLAVLFPKEHQPIKRRYKIIIEEINHQIEGNIWLNRPETFEKLKDQIEVDEHQFGQDLDTIYQTDSDLRTKGRPPLIKDPLWFEVE